MLAEKTCMRAAVLGSLAVAWTTHPVGVRSPPDRALLQRPQFTDTRLGVDTTWRVRDGEAVTAYWNHPPPCAGPTDFLTARFDTATPQHMYDAWAPAAATNFTTRITGASIQYFANRTQFFKRIGIQGKSVAHSKLGLGPHLCDSTYTIPRNLSYDVRQHDKALARRANKRWYVDTAHHEHVLFRDRSGMSQPTWYRDNTGARAFRTGAVTFTLFDPAVPECLARPKLPLRTAAAEIQYWCDLTALDGGYVLAATTGRLYYERTKWARRKLPAATFTNSSGMAFNASIGPSSPRSESLAQYTRWRTMVRTRMIRD